MLSMSVPNGVLKRLYQVFPVSWLTFVNGIRISSVYLEHVEPASEAHVVRCALRLGNFDFP